MLFISSPKNDRIKSIVKLQKYATRKELGLFCVEGIRELVLAHKGGYELEELYLCEDFLIQDEIYNLSFVDDNIRTIKVSPEAYQAMAYRDSTEGVIGVFKQTEKKLDDLQLKENPLILVIEAVEKPGNLGAMLRTADAVGVDAVLICDSATDLHNSNVIRSSLGTVFTNSIAVDSTRNIIDFLIKHNIRIFATLPNSEFSFYEKDYRQSTAIVVGAESTGLSTLWTADFCEGISIPMSGIIDSLNVSVAAAVVLYEANRQRNFV